jgi:CheY-like chemotaxis protein
MLRKHGCEITVAADGREALRRLQEKSYELILMDCQMPEMDGFDATRALRQRERARGADRTPVIALTANAFEEDRKACLDAGMDAFLTKPIDADALHQQVSRAIERQLARGVVLDPLPALLPPRPAARPSVAELDAMFGIDSGAPPPGLPAGSPGDAAAALRLRLRDAFVADLPGKLDELDAALAAADADAAGRLFHGLKGSAAYLQEMQLHALCAELERAADRALWPAIRLKLPRLHAMLERMLAPAAGNRPG